MPTMDERRAMAEAITRKIARHLKPELDFLKANGWGVTIFAFEFNEPGGEGAMAYLSTCEREGMIKLTKEWLAYQEAGLTNEPRGGRGQV